MNAHARAAESLLREKEQLARAVTASLYSEMPELLDKHGERGREKCLQDMRYNVEHLTPAVALEDLPMFLGYVEWLDNLLRARTVSTRDLIRCLELLDAEIVKRFHKDESAAIAPFLTAAVVKLKRGVT